MFAEDVLRENLGFLLIGKFMKNLEDTFHETDMFLNLLLIVNGLQPKSGFFDFNLLSHLLQSDTDLFEFLLLDL